MRLAAALLAAWIGFVGATANADAATDGTLILRNAAIYTLDTAHPWARALVVRNGRIVYVGNDEGTDAYDEPGARMLDLAGRMVMPAFHDSHTHPMSGGLRLLRCRLEGIKTARAIYAAVRACAARQPKHAWLIGSGWSPDAFGAAGPSRAELDRLVPDRPAYLATTEGFTAWVNSKALAAAGIDANGSETSVDGIRRDASTHAPTGLIERAAVQLLRSHLPTPSEAEYREALRQTTAIANRVGITSIIDAAATPPMVDAYHAADLAGELSVRVVAAQLVDPSQGEAQVDAMIARRARVHGPRFRADAAKIFLDGEFDAHTAAMREPYAGIPGERGELYVDPAVLDAIVRRLDAAGFLIHMHAMGDRAVHAGLDAIEHATRSNGARDRRHQIAHVGLAGDEDIARFGRLGVAANFQPVWFQADDPAMAPSEAALGPRRAAEMFPIARIAAAGALILSSSDWPSTPMNPLAAIQIAMTHRPLDGSKPAKLPRQRMTLPDMLAAYTRNAAWIAREDDIDGTIAVGRHADLVVLERNLFEVDIAALHTVRVLATLLDGQPVYRDAAFAWASPAR